MGTPPLHEQREDHRAKGHEEFVRLLRFRRDEPLVRSAPRSLDGVSVAGDAAVVAILRPSLSRCLLSVIQFADRSATVRLELAPPVDVPAICRKWTGHDCCMEDG